MFGGFTTIILFAILSTILIGLFIDFELYGKYDEKHIKKLRSRKLREKVSKSDEKAYDGKPNYSFSDKENEVSSYTSNDVAHEISSDVNEYTENSVQASYAEADIAHEIEENSASFEQDYAQENYMGYQNNIDDSYKNINFFGGVNTEITLFLREMAIQIMLKTTLQMSSNIVKLQFFQKMFMKRSKFQMFSQIQWMNIEESLLKTPLECHLQCQTMAMKIKVRQATQTQFHQHIVRLFSQHSLNLAFHLKMSLHIAALMTIKQVLLHGLLHKLQLMWGKISQIMKM